MRKKKNGNFIIFRAEMLKNYPKNEKFIKEQYQLLCNGIRDVTICDAACVAWFVAKGEQ